MSADVDLPQALRVTVTGRVQGVGFRPFVHRAATARGLGGRVRNAAGRVEIEVAGKAEALRAFVDALIRDAPPLADARIARVEPIAATPRLLAAFRIEASASADADPTGREAHLPPDRHVCGDCLRELFDPASRRHRHPFVNCTQCGPRYTVIRDLPYDRASTSMAQFALCPACRAEYEDPLDRRFHAEPLACPACGPRLRFARGDASETAPAAASVPGGRGASARADPTGHPDADALRAALTVLRGGGIVAVKGVGGYHLLCDARDERAVRRLRARKSRPDKPLAVMYPATGPDGLGALRSDLDPDAVEAAALLDPARPIVLVARRPGCTLAASVAPGLNEIGAMLPYSPLHALLAADFAGPLVATSGNRSGEPVMTDAPDATAHLAKVADAFLHHDRPILRPADDSVLRVIAGRARPIRVGRGIAPLELELAHALDAPTLALAGQSKVAIALGFGARAVLSPHIGDLDSPRGREVLARVAHDLQRLHGVQARRLVVDSHPGYGSRAWAREACRDDPSLSLLAVAHHHAHASAAAWERPDVRAWLALAWDGVGLGGDGSLWGGEALVGAPGRWQRVGSLRPFAPPGGERAAREPWRSAAALCWDAGVDFPRPIDGVALARAAWRRGLNAPATSAVGRLFDAAASLVLGLDVASFEAQGPMRIEALASAWGPGEALGLPLDDGDDGVVRIDWRAIVAHLADATIAPGARAADLHATLAQAALAQAVRLRDRHPFDAVALAGGVFQNRLLCREVLARFARAGMPVHLPERLAVNDGGLAVGQLVEVAAR